MRSPGLPLGERMIAAEKRKLGKIGPAVLPIGLGCYSLSGAYGKIDDQAGIDFIHQAIDLGMDHLDSSDMYGWGHNETLLGKALKGRRDRILLTSKFGQIQSPDGDHRIDGRPAYVMQACEASLARLKVDVIDVYYQHRIDPTVPIEETIGAMSRLIEQGKVRYLALSEARPETIRRAHAAHPLVAVQTEFSLLYRREAMETLEVTRKLGIAFVAYAPLGRSLLTGQHADPGALAEGDTRRRHPRFAKDNLAHNRRLVQPIEAMAAKKGCTPAQLALAWVLAQGDDIIALPGTKRIERLKENLGALDVKLTPAEIAQLADAIPVGAAAGGRYPGHALEKTFR